MNVEQAMVKSGACLRAHAGPCFDGRPDLCDDILTDEKVAATAPECECPTDDYCPKCHPRWYAKWRAGFRP